MSHEVFWPMGGRGKGAFEIYLQGGQLNMTVISGNL